MPLIEISCETEASYHDLSVLRTDFSPIVIGAPNSPIVQDLDPGEYFVAWRVFGEEHTKFKITLEGVTKPKKPIERKIHAGERSAASFKLFEVGDDQ